VVSKAAPGSQDLYWLPYLMGERTPHLDAAVRAGWIGLTASHTRAEMIRSVLEGVGYSQKDGLDIIEAMGIPINRIRMSGGGARSPFWRQLLADLVGKPVAVLENEEGSAYGAALLALAGTGESGSVEEIAGRVARETAVYTPDPRLQAVYREGHARYRALYPALEPFYHPDPAGGRKDTSE
jgi:xylulokinase